MSKTLIPFITCGDPDLETTGKLVKEAVKNGADIIQLGIPFSDPTAEGPIIEGSYIRALSGGVTTDTIFDFVRELRKEVTVPIVFMTYANVVFSYGAEAFISTCHDLEVSGLIIPDIPFEEKKEFGPLCKKYGVSLISLIAPASKERIAKIAKEAEGFVYIVCNSDTKELTSLVSVIKENTDIPCIMGSGISTPEQAKEMAALTDGVMIPAALMKMLEQEGKEAVHSAGSYIREMKEAVG